MGKGKLDIISDLKKLGICPGDKVLMHSSYKSLGTIDGGIDTFLDALMELLGPDGTLMLPTFTYDFVTLSNPVFDIRYTMSNVGYTTEVFRKKPGVVRSLHPTHSHAVWGKDKEKYIKDHYDDDVEVGTHSPIIKLKDNNGKILMVGCGITHNTMIHGAEIHMNVPYIFTFDYSLPEYHREYACIDENDCIHRKIFYHEFIGKAGWYQNYGRLANLMKVEMGHILEAESYVFDAEKTWNTVCGKMKDDPYYFVTREKLF